MKVILSIIVPVYQGEKYLEKCINCIKDQIENGIELILVDDGSQDDSWSKILSYSEKYNWVKAFHHNNRGVSFTRNQGIKQASGKYIWFVDVDDIIMPNSIQEILHIIQALDPDMVIFGYRSKLARKQLNEFDTVPSVSEGMYTKEQFGDCFWRLYAQNLIHNIGTKIYKTEKITENKLFFQDRLQFLEDALFCASVIQNVNYIYITDKLWYCYNLEINTDSLSHRYKENYLAGLNCLFEKLKDVIHPNREFYYYYLCTAQDVVENEFRRGKFTFPKFVSYIERIQKEEMYCATKKLFAEVFDENNFWSYIEKNLFFIAYIKAWKNVVKSKVLSLAIVNDLFDAMYTIYCLFIKRSKKK